MSDEYDAAVAASMQPNIAQSARVGFSIAADTNADAYAEAQRVARRTGVPVDTAMALPDEMRRQDRMGSIDFDALAKTSPATAALLGNVERAKVAHDDVDNLSGFESMLYSVGKFEVGTGRAIASSVPKFNEGMWGVARAGADTFVPEVLGRKVLADKFAQWGGMQREMASGLMPKADGLIESSWYSGMQSLGLNALLLPISLASGGSMAPMLAGMGLSTGGAAYGEARDKGVSVPQALAFGASQGVIEAGTEMIGMPALFSLLKPGQFARKAAEYMVKDQGGEQVATHLQDLNEWAVLNPDKTIGDYLRERPGAAVQTALATAFGGGGQVALMKGVEIIATRNDIRVDNADKTLDLLGRINEMATASKVLARDADTFEAHVSAIAETGQAPAAVFVSAQTLQQAGIAEQLAQVSPAVAEQMESALQMGGDIRIPIAEYATKIAPTEYAQAMVDHIKFDAEGFSKAEAQTYMQEKAPELQAEVDRVLGEQSADETWKASAQEVEDAVFGELQTAGRFTEHVNHTDAVLHKAFASVMAAKLGVTPMAFFKAHTLRVIAERMDGAQFDQAGNRATDTPSFKNWFGESKVVDAQGQPLRVFHGTAGDFDTFDPSRIGSNFGVDKAGFFFTDSPIAASGYADSESAFAAAGMGTTRPATEGANVMPVLLSIKNPLTIESYTDSFYTNPSVEIDEAGISLTDYFDDNRDSIIQFAKEGNHDGVLFSHKGKTLAVAFSPTQIKSATGNRGTFDPNDANILNQTTRGSFNPATNTIALLKNADLSTFLHESGHFFLEVQASVANQLAQDAAIHGSDTLKPGERQIIADHNALLAWFGIKDMAEWNNLDFEEKRAYHEQFARGFESYLFEGKAPSIELHGVFQRFRAWLLNVYKSLTALNVELTPEVRGVFDRMLATTEQIQLAEQARSMMPLFERADQAGMTPEDFADYQAQGVDATNTASEELQARGLRDMQWLHNARGRMIKKMQKESEARRAEVKMDARREIMSQPVYRAWSFLTRKVERDDMLDGEKARADYQTAMKSWEDKRTAFDTEIRKDAKQTVWAASEEGQKKYQKGGTLAKAQAKVLRREEKAIDAIAEKALDEWEKANRKPTDPNARQKSDPNSVDESQDSLFAAIAKLGGINKAELISTWGVDPADKASSGVFGKHVMRAEDKGLSIDGMAEQLSQYGYLQLDENGKWDLAELEQKFKAELGGDAQHSISFDYGAHQQQDSAGRDLPNPDAMQAGRLNRDSLDSMGLPPEVVKLLDAQRMVKRDGLHPDIVAEIFGFSSGDEMVRAIAAADKPGDAIEGLTDQRMLEQYGDLSSQQEIEKAADQAIHNDVRSRMVATEANALAKATGKPKILAEAAKAFAGAMIARLKVRNITPGQYASAEARAAKAAAKASKAGDLVTAGAEKRNQLINGYATRAAYDAQTEVEKELRYLKKLDSAAARKGMDADYIDQIDALLDRFDLRKGQPLKAIDKRASFAKWLETQRDAGMEPDVPEALVNEAFRKSYKDMSVEEFRGLVDTVKQIEHLGRLKRRLLTAKDQREFAVIVEEAGDSIRDNGGDERDIELEAPTGIVPWLEGIAAGHRKFASMLRQMDGGKDNGPMWRILGRTMNESATSESVMLEKATVALAEIYKPILALKGGTTGDLKFIPEIGSSLTRGGRLAVALNWGNETNRSRIMDGDKWSAAQVNAILSTLTREEFQFVQNVWAYIDSYWSQIAEKERRVTGRAPDKVKADPFFVTLADGSTMSLMGGYYPIKYDSNRDDRAEKHDAAAVADDMKRGAFTRATTRRGHTKERVENVKRPVRKTLDVITQHVSEVAHDLAWHEWLIDANRLIDAKPINTAIRAHYGTEVVRTIKDMLTAIATADIVPQTKIDQAMFYLRANVSRSTMGLSLTTAFMQPFGLTQSMVRIGPKHVLRGMARWGGDIARFENSMTWIGEKSDFMRLRSNTFNRELHEIKGRVSHGHSQARQIYDASLFMLTQKMQMVADVPTWIGAYEKATSENHDDATAVAMADQAVLDSQGGGQTKDMAEFQRKHPMLAMFYSYFNVTINLAAELTARTNFKNPLAVAGWMSDMALLMVIPALGPAILLELMRGGDDDDANAWAKKLASWQVGYLLGMVIGVREASGLVSGYDYAGPPVGRVIADLGSLGKQVVQGDLDENLALSSIRLMGTALGVPTVQVIRSWRGWNAWADGDASPAAVLLGPPPKR